MNDADLMNILNASNELMKHSDGFGFINPLILDDIVKQFSTLHVFHDQEELFGSLYDFVKLDDIGVAY